MIACIWQNSRVKKAVGFFNTARAAVRLD